MEQKTEDYLYLYPNVELICIGTGGYQLTCIEFDREIVYVAHPDFGIEDYKYSDIKLVLRPLSDMTEEECAEVYLIENYGTIIPLSSNEYFIRRKTSGGDWEVVKTDDLAIKMFISLRDGHVYQVFDESEICNAKNSAKTFKYLLEKGFDLFGLIEAGLAIDKTTLK